MQRKSLERFLYVSASMLALLMTATAVACSQSDTSAPPGRPTHGSMSEASSADKGFVKSALRGGMAEVELGKLASEQGNSADVKQFGQKMVEDHTKLGDQMKEVAGKIGVTPPSMVTPMDKTEEMKLKALSGDDFDKAYIKAMLKDHRKDLEEFKKEAGTGTLAEVKHAAAQGAEVIAQHLEMIEKIARAHNVATGGD